MAHKSATAADFRIDTVDGRVTLKLPALARQGPVALTPSDAFALATRLSAACLRVATTAPADAMPIKALRMNPHIMADGSVLLEILTAEGPWIFQLQGDQLTGLSSLPEAVLHQKSAAGSG